MSTEGANVVKYICDKCGEVVERVNIKKLPYAFENYVWKYRAFDLCEDCFAEVTHLVNMETMSWLGDANASPQEEEEESNNAAGSEPTLG